MTVAGLTRSQFKVREFIRGYILEHGESPSFDEIKVGCGFHSKGAVHRNIAMLVARGAIKHRPGQARSITIVGGSTITLPPELDRQVRALATRPGVTVEAVVIECVRDRLSADRSLSVSRETENSRARAAPPA